MGIVRKPLTIYLIRHGQTVGNGHHYVGWEDLPLNENGEIQAHTIAELLHILPITTIVSSSLCRAIKTAEPLVSKKNIQLRTDSRLNEINYGLYQGRFKSELNLKLRKDYLNQRLPQGESLHDVYLRVRQFWDDYSQHETKADYLAIFSHYWSIRMLYGILQDSSFEDLFAPNGYKPANGSIFVMALEKNAERKMKYVPKGYIEHNVTATQCSQ